MDATGIAQCLGRTSVPCGLSSCHDALGRGEIKCAGVITSYSFVILVASFETLTVLGKSIFAELQWKPSSMGPCNAAHRMGGMCEQPAQTVGYTLVVLVFRAETCYHFWPLMCCRVLWSMMLYVVCKSRKQDPPVHIHQFPFLMLPKKTSTHMFCCSCQLTGYAHVPHFPHFKICTGHLSQARPLGKWALSKKNIILESVMACELKHPPAKWPDR